MTHREINTGGFTATELTVSITILMGIAAMLGLIFARGDRIWKTGIDDARIRQSGRLAIELLSRDLGQAATDERLRMLIEPDGSDTGLQYENHRLRFISLQTPAHNETGRIATAVSYWIGSATDASDELFLMRSVRRSALIPAERDLYANTNWIEDAAWTNGEAVAGIVTAFRAPVPRGASLREWDIRGYDSRAHSNRCPAYVDIFLELLAPRDADKLETLSDDERINFIERRAVRFTARIRPANQWGYGYRGR